jgi:hypothetical protein
VKGLNHINEFIGSLMDRSVSMNNPVIDATSSRKTIKKYAFQGCSGLTGSLVIGDNIGIINNAAFSGCTGLNGTLTIGSGVTYIRNNAFSVCSNLTGDIVIPDSVAGIGSYAFQNCSGLRGTITIGTGVTSIGSYAFDGIQKIQSITILATTPPTIGGANNSFGSPTLFNFPIYVPSASLRAYKRTYTSYDNAGRIKAIQDSRD